jgi:hypothetical protein
MLVGSWLMPDDAFPASEETPSPRARLRVGGVIFTFIGLVLFGVITVPYLGEGQEQAPVKKTERPPPPYRPSPAPRPVRPQQRPTP